MDALSARLVGHPVTVAAIALVFVALFLLLRRYRPGAPRRAAGAAAAGWVLYALWEALVLWRTPDANIRVDLLLIWPVLGLLSLWALWQALRRRPAPA